MSIKIIKPKNGQESVWDYPRPPKLERFKGHISIVFNGVSILETNDIFRVLETSHPPTYYLPIKDFKSGVLIPNDVSSFCEFKGRACYYDIHLADKKVIKAAWQYPEATAGYQPIQMRVAVYAHLMDACFVNDEQVDAQEGSFYGGWITSNIVGPFKGADGTWGW